MIGTEPEHLPFKLLKNYGTNDQRTEGAWLDEKILIDRNAR
jgi:hypothetical protein